MKKLEYYTVIKKHGNRFDSDVIDTEINKLLREGWGLYGSPYSASHGTPDDIGFYLCQALIREIDTKEKEE